MFLFSDDFQPQKCTYFVLTFYDTFSAANRKITTDVNSPFSNINMQWMTHWGYTIQKMTLTAILS